MGETTGATLLIGEAVGAGGVVQPTKIKEKKIQKGRMAIL
jgi:hypothetical protein